MTNSTVQQVLHLVSGLVVAGLGAMLVLTGHLDASTGVALILGGLGVGSSTAAALATPGGLLAAPATVAATSAGAVPIVPVTGNAAPTGLGSLQGSGASPAA